MLINIQGKCHTGRSSEMLAGRASGEEEEKREQKINSAEV